MTDAVRHYIRDNLPKTVRECKENNGTLLALPFPYTVPCAGAMFQELYYWDTYFTNVGLLCRGELAVARHNIDNMLWLVDTYGFMPNGNRTYYLNRSQPPFLSAMVRELYAAASDDAWLARAYRTLCKEYTFWQTKRQLPCGLNAYTGYTVQEDDLDMIYAHFVSRTGYCPTETPGEAIKRDIFLATFSFFESGWDCNSRFLTDGHHTAAVDLNALLYGMETDMAAFARILDNGDEAVWRGRATRRCERMNALLWDETTGAFRDLNTRTGEWASYLSAASLYPLFVGLATPAQATAALPLFERLLLPHGIACGVADSPWGCQWDYPNVWAPLQWIAYRAMKRYGFTAQAAAVASRFTTLVEHTFDKTGNLWEKYNGLTGEVAADEYDAPPMMGWTAGVYTALSQEER